MPKVICCELGYNEGFFLFAIETSLTWTLPKNKILSETTTIMWSHWMFFLIWWEPVQMDGWWAIFQMVNLENVLLVSIVNTMMWGRGWWFYIPSRWRFIKRRNCWDCDWCFTRGSTAGCGCRVIFRILWYCLIWTFRQQKSHRNEKISVVVYLWFLNV